MTLIKKREAVDVFANESDTITICNKDIFSHERNKYEDIIVTVHPDDVDTIIAALKSAKKEIEDAREEELNN